jgi:hypothetical protein
MPVRSRDSRVRPKRPSAFRRTFGFSVTFPVLCRVYETVVPEAPVPGISGWWWVRPTFSTARAGTVGPPTRR